MILPANIYNPKSHVRLDFSNYDTDVRFTNYYMGKYQLLVFTIWKIASSDETLLFPYLGQTDHGVWGLALKKLIGSISVYIIWTLLTVKRFTNEY